MIFQDIADIAKSDPRLLPASVLGVFGVGLNTYQTKIKTDLGGLKIKIKSKKLPGL
jgi:hypothetical protein